MVSRDAMRSVPAGARVPVWAVAVVGSGEDAQAVVEPVGDSSVSVRVRAGVLAGRLGVPVERLAGVRFEAAVDAGGVIDPLR